MEPIRRKTPSEALAYVRYRHDEKTKAPVYDENGKMMLREDYYLDGLNCPAAGFPLAYENLCQRFGKNLEDEILMYQIIISYNPQDKAQYLLDGEKAQKLSLGFARTYLKGLLGIVCTHMDGDHHAGNIHTHIYVAAIKYSDEYCEEMKYPFKERAGYKIDLNLFTEMELRRKLAEMVEREGLYPDNLTILPDVRISNREYHVRANGQKKLDAANEEKICRGIVPEERIFRTDKQIIREAIGETLERTETAEEFRNTLSEQFHVMMIWKDGAWRYGLEGSNATFAAPSLGALFLWENIEEQLRQNRETREPSHMISSALGSKAPAVKHEPTTQEIWESMSFARKLWGLPNDLYEYLDQNRSLWEDGSHNKLMHLALKVLQYFSDRHIRSFDDLGFWHYKANETLQKAFRMIEQLESKLRVARNLFHFGRLVEKVRSLPLVMEMPNRNNRKSITNQQAYEDAVGFLQEHHVPRDFTSQSLWEEKMMVRRLLDGWKRIRDEKIEELNLIGRFYRFPPFILLILRYLDKHRADLVEEKLRMEPSSPGMSQRCERMSRYGESFRNLLSMERERQRALEIPEPVYVEKTRIRMDYER